MRAKERLRKQDKSFREMHTFIEKLCVTCNALDEASLFSCARACVCLFFMFYVLIFYVLCVYVFVCLCVFICIFVFSAWWCVFVCELVFYYVFMYFFFFFV